MDMDSRHLQIVAENVPRSKSHLLTCVLGSLPHEIPLANASVSGILLSEVLHFLQGDDIKPAFTTLYQKLTPGGYLYVSTLSIHFFDCIDRTIVKDFFIKLDNGHAWPGVVLYDDNMLAKHHEAAKRAGGKYAIEPDSPGRPDYVHFCVLKQLTDVLCDVGFDIENFPAKRAGGKYAIEPDSPGRPDYVHFCVLKQLTDVLCDVGFDIESAEEGRNKGKFCWQSSCKPPNCRQKVR